LLAYDGPEQPPPETVTIQNSSRFAFWSFVTMITVDGRNVLGWNEITVLPGVHWYQAMVSRRSKLAMFLLMDAFYVEAMCGFRLEAAAGKTFRLVDVEKDGFVPDNAAKFYKASLVIEERSPGGDSEAYRIPAECADLELFQGGWYRYRDDMKAKGGALCQSDQDCLMEGAACDVGADFSFGVCRKP
jgi:hypothetical protein